MTLDDADKAFLLDAMASIGQGIIETMREEIRHASIDVSELGESLGTRLTELEVDIKDIKRHVAALSHDGMSQKHESMRKQSRVEKRMTAFDLALAELRKTLAEHEHQSDKA